MKTANVRAPRLSPAASGGDERHLWDYVRVLYKRRWIAIPASCSSSCDGDSTRCGRRRSIRSGTQLLIEKDAPTVATTRPDVPVAGRLVQRRVLPDAVPHPAEPRAGEADDRHMKLWDAPRLGNGPEPQQPDQRHRHFSGRWWTAASDWRSVPSPETSRRRCRWPPRLHRARRPPTVRTGSSPHASPSSSEGCRSFRSGTPGSWRSGTRPPIRHSPRRQRTPWPPPTSSRAWTSSSMASKEASDFLSERLAEQRKAVEASERRAAGIQGTEWRRLDRRRQLQHRDPAPDRFERRADQGEDRAHQQGSALQPAQVGAGDRRARQPARRHRRTSTSRG